MQVGGSGFVIVHRVTNGEQAGLCEGESNLSEALRTHPKIMPGGHVIAQGQWPRFVDGLVECLYGFAYVGRDPPGLVARDQFGRRSPGGFLSETQVSL
jgi:hypothetical protein